jgi:hypothetical protein
MLINGIDKIFASSTIFVNPNLFVSLFALIKLASASNMAAWTLSLVSANFSLLSFFYFLPPCVRPLI